jgi:hypothetical protein
MYDFSPITPGVAAKRAARVAVGFGGHSSAFAPALSPAPLATTAPVGFDGLSSPFGLALSATPIDTRTARGRDFSVTHPCFTQKPGCGVLPSRSKQCFEPPDKDMNFQCTTAAFTLPLAPVGLRHLVLTRPGTEPSMRLLFVGSHLCARACCASRSRFACKSSPLRPCSGRSRLLSRRLPSRHPLAGLPLPSASSFIRPLRGLLRYSYRGLAPHKLMPMPGVHK